MDFDSNNQMQNSKRQEILKTGQIFDDIKELLIFCMIVEYCIYNF